MSILLHPYTLVLYGIILWQIEQSFTHGFNYRERRKNIGKSLVWGSLIVIFDDEGMEFVEEHLDIVFETDWYFYSGGGFFIDIIRSKFSKHEEAYHHNNPVVNSGGAGGVHPQSKS